MLFEVVFLFVVLRAHSANSLESKKMLFKMIPLSNLHCNKMIILHLYFIFQK